MTLKYKYRNTRRATREAKAHQMLAALLTHRHIQKEAVAVITRDRRQSSSSEITQQLKSLMAQWAVCFDSEWVEHCAARFLYIAAFRVEAYSAAVPVSRAVACKKSILFIY